MKNDERLIMMAEDYERRAAEQRLAAAELRKAGRANYARAANANARKYETQAADLRAVIERNASALAADLAAMARASG